MQLENEDDFQPTREDGYERRDASIRGLLLFGLFLAAVLVFVFFAMKWSFDWFASVTPRGEPAAPFATAQPATPAPLLQASPHFDLRSYCTGELAQLNSYGWVDKNNGVVHIPISRAMDIVVQQGFPARPESQIPSYDKQAVAPVGTVNALPPSGTAGQCAFVDENPGAGHTKSDNSAPRGAQ